MNRSFYDLHQQWTNNRSLKKKTLRKLSVRSRMISTSTSRKNTFNACLSKSSCLAWIWGLELRRLQNRGSLLHSRKIPWDSDAPQTINLTSMAGATFSYWSDCTAPERLGNLVNHSFAARRIAWSAYSSLCDSSLIVGKL